MKNRAFLKTAAAVATFGAALLLGLLVDAPRGHAASERFTGPGNSDDERIQTGLAIAPVPLNLLGKDLSLVGLGSYLVNSVGDCNGCHSAGPTTEFAPGRNPYFGQPTLVNPATYLGGGRDFGALVPNSPDIVSRNLTPDKTGMSGGNTFSQFYQIIRTGIDMDHLHPNCSSAIVAGCLPQPFNGAVLQIMPWPAFQNLSIHDLQAIYEYLNSIPCVEGGPGEPAERCK